MLVLRAHKGRLDQMLSVMSPTQLKEIVGDVPKYMATLAQYTSPRLETVDGVGTTSQWLSGECHPHVTWPSWKPNVTMVIRCIPFSCYLAVLET